MHAPQQLPNGDRCGPEARLQRLTTALLAQHVSGRRFDTPNDAGWPHVRRALLDTYGVAVAATREPVVEKLRRVLGGGFGVLGSWATTGARARADDVALINGTAAHALDFDDVSPAVRGHPSAVLLPAILAVAGPESTLLDVGEAYAIGFEVGALLSQALPGGEHYARGWHATATLGTLMAGAAVARLRAMDPDGVATVLGIAASMASGSRQNFGTMTKPLHAGMAARNGVLAAALAEEGLTADASQIEGPFGFLALFKGESTPGPVQLPAGPALLSDVGLNVKRHPCCYFTHHAIDATLSLRDADLKPGDVEAIDVEVQPRGLTALPYDRPATGLEAKFSMPYCVSAALVGGVLTLGDFTDEAVRRSEVTRLMERVRCRESAPPHGGTGHGAERYAVVTARTRSGTTLQRRVEITIGDARRPLSEENLVSKVRSCLAAGRLEDRDGICEELVTLQPSMTVEQGLARTLRSGRQE